jgi:hypothetical protein
VVIENVDDPAALPVSERHLGRIDLPEIVRGRTLEALVGRAPPRRLGRHQMVALERTMDRGHRRRRQPGPGKLSMDPPRPPTRMLLAQQRDLRLKLRLDLPRRAARGARARLKPCRPLLQVAAPVPVETRPRDPPPTANLRHRIAGALRLEQHLQPELAHRDHPERHTFLPRSLPQRGQG